MQHQPIISQKQSEHDAHVYDLYVHPHIIGLDHIIFKTLNAQFRDGVNIIYEPDVLLMNSGIYVVEYKCSNMHKDKALKQLMRGYEWIYQNWHRKSSLIYVWGSSYNYERIR